MKKQVITIGRQCGSGGYRIAKTLAQRLGVPFYDKDFLDAAADQESGHVPSCTSLLFSLATGMYDGYLLTKNGSNALTVAQAKVIRRLADQGPCVIVGRCADYILRDREDCLRVFIHGDIQDRVDRMVTEERFDPDAAHRLVTSRDSMRGNHYQYLTGQPWGQEENYDLFLDSSQLGIERCIDQILAACE